MTNYRDGAAKLLTENASQVLSLLTMYMAASGMLIPCFVLCAIVYRKTICRSDRICPVPDFRLLTQLGRRGEMNVGDVANTPLLEFAFTALDSPSLFDAAVDVICDLIHETQEIDESMPVIQIIVPKLIAVKSKIAGANDDTDQMRGYARIFSEAGEVYRLLLLQHPETFFPIVEAIGECRHTMTWMLFPSHSSFGCASHRALGRDLRCPRSSKTHTSH